jgi:release factor glutamine methyltransferase
VTHWKNVWALSGALGVDDTLRAMLADHPRAAALSTRPSVLGSICAFGWRVTRELRNVRRVPVARDALLGEPWRGAVTRCRFGGVELLAGPRVFLPRKVSEPMVGVAVERLANVDRPVVVDVGTGCGAIALALARRIPAAHVLGFDMDPTAVTWARRNGFRLELPHVQFATGSLLDSLPASLHGRVDLVGANVPCLPPGSFAGAADAPNEAYVGSDPDGLGLQRRLAEQARRVLKPGGWLLVQLAPSQWPAYAEVVNGLGYRTEAPRADEIAVITAVQAP